MFPESELILKPDGAIYHLNLHPEELADTVIIVGDPARVAKVSKYFDSIELKKQNREINTHTGMLRGKRLTVMSTGMGTDNIEICMNELDALVNIDLKTRTLKDKLTKLNIVRLGTSGALQTDIPLGSYVASTHGVGLDVLMSYYKRQLSAEVQDLTAAFLKHLGDDAQNIRPYIGAGSTNLIDLFQDKCIKGMTATGAGFYAAQGRVLRYELAIPQLMDRIESFSHNGHRITNFEMETSAIYALGAELLGHNCCSINLIIANRPLKTFTKDLDAKMEEMIQMALEKLMSL
ncbi:MAG: nucleoside phosphorylase [Gammaproteobacteria bacterium]|nr:nucleoside phosphorylase [Gammaproteobacteria bacterium]